MSEQISSQAEDSIPTVELPEESSVVIDDTPVEETVSSIEDKSDKEESASEKSDRTQQRVLQEFDYNLSETPSTADELVLPSDFDSRTRKVLEKVPNINLLDNQESRRWASDLGEGLEYTTYNETFVPTVEDQEADFRHRMEHNNISLSGQPPKFKPAENQNLKGERAVIRMINHLGLGTLFQTPLWHSGIWVTFKPPAESEIIELNRLLIADKIKFGRYTYGLAFSNITAYTIDRIVDFALSHVYDITVKPEDITIDNLRNHISCQDIPSLIWGFVCTMYPRGFKYRRACSNDPEKCNHVLEEVLNLMKLQWTNNNALTDWQKTFMSGRQPKLKDLAGVTRYKEELRNSQKKRITINPDTDRAVSFVIRTPSIGEYIEAGHRWIGDITNTVDRALNTDASENERNNLIVRYGQASAMRQYIHWVESIEYETNVIDDRETIERTLDVLSADDEVRSKFIQAVIDYINKSTISVVGIPVFDCPKCQTVQEGKLKLPQYTNIIPLDMVQLFFGLLTQRLSRLTDR